MGSGPRPENQLHSRDLSPPWRILAGGLQTGKNPPNVECQNGERNGDSYKNPPVGKDNEFSRGTSRGVVGVVIHKRG